jgi:general secretion pathway protein I
MRSKGSADQGGFTLLEVLVAFAVLAVMIVPMLQVFGSGLGTTETARAYSTAALLARSKLAATGVEAPLREGETAGFCEIPGYRWRQTVARDASEMPQPDRAGEAIASDESSGAGATGRHGQRSNFRDEQSGFGGNRAGFGSGSRSFGGSGDSFSELSSAGRSGSSAFSSGQSLSTGGFGSRNSRMATQGGEAGGQRSEDLIRYEVTVTIEWDNRGGGGVLSLSTLRLGRPENEARQR